GYFSHKGRVILIILAASASDFFNKNINFITESMTLGSSHLRARISAPRAKIFVQVTALRATPQIRPFAGASLHQEADRFLPACCLRDGALCQSLGWRRLQLDWQRSTSEKIAPKIGNQIRPTNPGAVLSALCRRDPPLQMAD